MKTSASPKALGTTEVMSKVVEVVIRVGQGSSSTIQHCIYIISTGQ